MTDGHLRPRSNFHHLDGRDLSKIGRERHQTFDSSGEPGLTDLRKSEDFRCTVHIEDVLFQDTLYQLLDYFPEPGGPAGRRFSIRFGMIGLAWRTKKDQGDGDAAATTDEDLITHWGMKEDEARRGSRRRASYLCVMLKTDTGDPMGILFMDAKEKYYFGDRERMDQLARRIRHKSKEVGFQDGLSESWKSCGNTEAVSKYMADIRQSYSAVADEYYDVNRPFTCANFRSASAIILRKHLPRLLRGEVRACELGAGRSLFAEMCKEMGRYDVLAGLVISDASPEMLFHSRRWTAYGSVLTRAEASALPYPDEYFNLLVAILSIRTMSKRLAKRCPGYSSRTGIA